MTCFWPHNLQRLCAQPALARLVFYKDKNYTAGICHKHLSITHDELEMVGEQLMWDGVAKLYWLNIQ